MMSGNVAERCYDIYGDVTIDTDLVGAKTGDYRVFRVVYAKKTKKIG